MKTTDLERSVNRNKQRDRIFAVLGLLSTFVGMLTLAALLIDLMMDGAARLAPHFFTSFPSRFPGQAGILSAWVGTTLVMVVTAFTAVPSGTFGNAKRNSAQGYPFYQVDFALSKYFPLPWRESKLQLRIEAFNLFNKTNFRAANSNRSAAAFGTITLTYDARQIQLGLKLLF